MSTVEDPIASKLNGSIWVGIRVLAGLLWIQNVGWKYPPNFEILGRSIQRGIDQPTWGPFSSFLDAVVIDNLVAFGWLTLMSELVVGAMLLAGFSTRLAALIGVVQSLFIGLTVAGVEHEWGWSYWMMVAVHAAIYAAAAGRFCGVDGIMRPRLAASNRQLARLYLGFAS